MRGPVSSSPGGWVLMLVHQPSTAANDYPLRNPPKLRWRVAAADIADVTATAAEVNYTDGASPSCRCNRRGAGLPRRRSRPPGAVSAADGALLWLVVSVDA
jgi:hypothetical protein